ncbi:hypothetical protein BDY21DRAFT_332175 [Lineolata rhizophorae]|uniref:Uncharacterized protein n=1 Tax=Lineolata rhizophorae TaxID=578093 RepID=A0A6A6PBU4_9PEZI|nr:hypothetical protein BDY21DRAFT_332175 [Lineolata rhizophorae]
MPALSTMCTYLPTFPATTAYALKVAAKFLYKARCAEIDSAQGYVETHHPLHAQEPSGERKKRAKNAICVRNEPPSEPANQVRNALRIASSEPHPVSKHSLKDSKPEPETPIQPSPAQFNAIESRTKRSKTERYACTRPSVRQSVRPSIRSQQCNHTGPKTSSREEVYDSKRQLHRPNANESRLLETRQNRVERKQFFS